MVPRELRRLGRERESADAPRLEVDGRLTDGRRALGRRRFDEGSDEFVGDGLGRKGGEEDLGRLLRRDRLILGQLEETVQRGLDPLLPAAPDLLVRPLGPGLPMLALLVLAHGRPPRRLVPLLVLSIRGG
jgi:hypothetical protein